MQQEVARQHGTPTWRHAFGPFGRGQIQREDRIEERAKRQETRVGLQEIPYT